MFRAAIVGVGFMGGAHAEALRRIGVEVTSVLGIDSNETASFAQRVKANGYASLEQLLTDESIDVVHLCTPNYLHFPMAKAALEAGKHVMCEKPLAMTSREAAELARLVKASKRAGAVNYNIRFYPMNQEARSRIQKGTIGEPRILHAEYCQDWLFLPTDWNWRLIAKEGGDLRVVGDIGTHVLDMLRWLTGLEIVEVMADLETFIPIRRKPRRMVETFASKLSTETNAENVKIDTEDFAALLLRFNNGARGVVSLSQVNAGRKNNFWWEINGSAGSMYWRQERPNELWLGYREKPNEVMLKDPALMDAEVRRYAAFPGGHAEGYPDTLVRHFSDFYNYLEAGNFDQNPTFPTFEDGCRELVLCEAIQRSARERCWVEVSK